MKLKVLQRESWMCNIDFNDIDCTSCYKEEITPRFNRNGWYLLYHSNETVCSLCWFESDGRAFTVDIKDFQYKLNQLNYRNNPLRKNEIEALEILNKSNPRYLSKEQFDILFNHQQMNNIYRIKLQAMLEFKHLFSKNKTIHVN